MDIILDIKFPYDFVEKIKDKFRQTVVKKLFLTNFIKIDMEMNELFQFDEVVLSKEIITYALDNMEIVKYSNYYLIRFDQIINYPGTKIKLITLLRFISYGNSNVHGNSILTDEFKELNRTLSLRYKIYKLRGVVG